MRGSPLFRAFVAFLVLLGFGVPLWRLTLAEAPKPPEIVVLQKDTPLKEVRVRLDFTEAPTGLRVLHLGKEIWADPAPGGGPPNNWLSSFGGPAWTWSEARGQPIKPGDICRVARQALQRKDTPS